MKFQTIKRKLSEAKLAVIMIGLFAAVGVIVLTVTHAATPVASSEAESGVISGQASLASDTTASGSAAVRFGNGTGSSPAWKPLAPGLAWQWQLTGTVDETVLDNVTAAKKVYDIDMFNATPALVSRLKAKNIYVICYVESGDWAKGRPDAGDFAPAILGKALDGFPDEKFINVNALDSPAGPTGKTLRQIMMARLDLAKSKGCDGVEPDLDDLQGYSTGFTITQANQVAHNAVLIQAAHDRGMSMGLKNGASANTGSGSFEKQMLDVGADWAINEECNQFAECAGYTQFVAAGKAVLQVEYLDDQKKPYDGATGTCAKDNAANFDGIVKDSSSILSALPRIACR